MSPLLALELKQRARELGFDLCGIAEAGASPNSGHLAAWLSAGKHGEMAWLEKRFEERADVREYLPGARSVICCAMSYNVPLEAPPEGEISGRVARYALGDDYHDHLKKKLFDLADWLRGQAECETRVCVDTAPVLEREWAQRSGIAWQAKNTLAIHPTLGSYLLLGEIITTLPLPADEPAIDRCGTCTRCIDACPTDAITPYEVDATRCLSYWNIEYRGEEMPEDIALAMGDRLFGCDICQEVCPWNRKAPAATSEAVRPRLPSASLDVRDVLTWEPETYRQRLRGSAMKRVKLPILQRNARIVLENTGK